MNAPHDAPADAAPGRKGPGSAWAWAGLAFLAVTWGGAFALIKVAVADAPPGVVVLGRLAIGAAALTAWALYRGRRFPPLVDVRWRWFLALGLFGNALPFYLIAHGQQTVDSGLAGILIGAMPLATIAGAHFVIPGERLTPARLGGFALGFAGVLILMGPAALTDLGGPTFIAQLAIFAASLSYATNAVMAQIAPETPPSVSAAMMLIGATLWATPGGALALAGMDATPGAASLAAILALGLLPTGAAAMVYMTLAKRVGAAFIAQTNYLVPVAAAFIGVAIGETLGWTAFAALAVILSGLFVARRG